MYLQILGHASWGAVHGEQRFTVHHLPCGGRHQSHSIPRAQSAFTPPDGATARLHHRHGA